MCVCDCMALVITFRVAMLTVYEIFITFITHKPLAIRTAATLAAVSVEGKSAGDPVSALLTGHYLMPVMHTHKS